MFNKKPKKAKLKFINLAEHLAQQNDIVGRTLDSMLTHVVESEDVKQRSDWAEIQKTSEQFSKVATTVPAPSSKVPKPKTQKHASNKSSEPIGS